MSHPPTSASTGSRQLRRVPLFALEEIGAPSS